MATVNGHSAIGVIRLTGKETHRLLARIFKPENKKIILLSDYPSRSIYGRIIWQENVIDDVIVLIFSKQKSYTGEEAAEIHAHGNPIILKKILKILYHIGFTQANPGEFTRRAYLAGKIDLTQAEAVKEIIEARSERQLQKAILQKEGLLKKRIHQFRSDILNITADLTAQLDFSDEGIDFKSQQATIESLVTLKNEIHSLIKNAKMNAMLKDGIEMVLIGAPNAGKSSLMNTLTGKNRSIVSETPGTTRDYIDAQMEISGFPVVLVDTAGIRKISDEKSNSKDTNKSADEIEKLGIKKTIEKFLEADLRLILIDASISPKENLFHDLKGYLHSDHADSHVHRSILILNKWDIVSNDWKNNLENEEFWTNLFIEEGIIDEMFYSKWNQNIIPVSAKTSFGMGALVKKMEQILEDILPHNDSINLAPWQSEIMEKVEENIIETMDLLSSAVSAEIVVENLNQIMHYLSEFTGEYNNEELLGRIFSRFCIGK
ncbi:MAG: tRNA uridine-5-carboxymethylaminomethyl(34) synthesis GTPase MnmE [Spirochaetia bacterium]|nr:tRNA uridine-5-carboxymethylaminomethyl(34) synthesis GTPase MnmE [Spirochaetia bacterium]